MSNRQSKGVDSVVRLLRIVRKKYEAFKLGDDVDVYHIDYIRGLIARGLKLGKNVTIEANVFIDSGYPYLISVGSNCAIGTGARILAHDDTPYRYTGGYARLGQVNILDNVCIGENCIILPGVTIGPDVLIASGSVVNKTIPPNSCIAGVPARFYAKLDEYIANQKEMIAQAKIFRYDDIGRDHIDPALRDEVIAQTAKNICYVKGKDNSRFEHVHWNVEG
jgi:maltose O-acetyltransferase